MSAVSTNHEGFNLFVQGVQREAEAWRIETGFERVGIYNFFYALWDDKKWFLAREVPFAAGGDRDARIDPEQWIKLQCQLAA